VEVTARTIGGLFLLRPSEEVNEIIRGILARYARIHEMKVIFWVVLSNHMLCAAAHKACYVEQLVM
jgi:hypothetical protein